MTAVSAESRKTIHLVRNACCLLLYWACLPVSAGELLLTGKVDLLNTQEFVAPWNKSYHVKIQWMADEGSVAEAGDLVVIFDSGELVSSIEQNETALEDNAQGTHETLLKLEQALIDAEHELTQAGLKLQIAKLKATVPPAEVSKMEYETAQFELTKAHSDLERAKVKLDLKQLELDNEKARIALEVQRIEAALASDKQSLAQMSVRAERGGPVIHAMHPWLGGKIEVGQNIQMGIKVASIPVTEDMVVKSWVSEVDWPKVSEGSVVILAADAYLNEPFKGVIEKIGLQSEKKKRWGSSSYYELTIDFEKPSGFELKPGMSILVRVPLLPTPGELSSLAQQ